MSAVSENPRYISPSAHLKGPDYAKFVSASRENCLARHQRGEEPLTPEMHDMNAIALIAQLGLPPVPADTVAQLTEWYRRANASHLNCDSLR